LDLNKNFSSHISEQAIVMLASSSKNAKCFINFTVYGKTFNPQHSTHCTLSIQQSLSSPPSTPPFQNTQLIFLLTRDFHSAHSMLVFTEILNLKHAIFPFSSATKSENKKKSAIVMRW
jgi:hypothetical protein